MSKSRKTIQHAGTINEVVTVTCRVDLPEHIYLAYATLAERSNIDVETLMTQQLARCRDIIGNGIYFNEGQKKRLGNVIGRTISDAEGALQHLETSTVISVEGFEFPLDPRLVQRLRTRVFRGENYRDVMYREIVRALMTHAGMSPSASNTGGWWRYRGVVSANGAKVAATATAVATTVPKEATHGQG